MERRRRFPPLLAVLVVGVAVWSLAFCATPYGNWLLEAAVPLAGLAVLPATYRRFPLTNVVYALIALEMVVMLVGARTTYEREPLFDWLRGQFDLSRNHFDRVGHFMQGAAPALLAREILRRLSPLPSGGWLFYLCLASTLGISAVWEILEWQVCVWATPGQGDAWLGAAGDVFDTQKDMFLCGVGAAASLLLLGGVDEREMRRRQWLPAPS